MNLIVAYINAVKTNLPSKQREDIGEELRDLLEESFALEQGKSLEESSEEEVVDWLSKREHPALVAARYYERRSLVGEDSFPLFKMAVRYTFLGLCVAYVLLAVLRVFKTGEFSFSIVGLAADLLHSGLIAFACIALVFHFFGGKIGSQGFLVKWNPKDLPKPDSKWEHEPWSSSISNLVFTALFLLLINGFLDFSQGNELSRFEGVRIVFMDPVLSHLPFINSVLVASILLYAFMLFRPYWSALTLSLSILLNFATAFIAYQIVRYEAYIDVAIDPASRSEIPHFIGSINDSIAVALYIVMGISLFEIVRKVWRLCQLGTQRLV